MIDPPFIEGEGMPIKIRTDADENRADVMVLPVLRNGELPPATSAVADALGVDLRAIRSTLRRKDITANAVDVIDRGVSERRGPEVVRRYS
jgi:hypothetical protein